VTTRELRGRDGIALALIGAAGLAATAIGLVVLASSDKIGFDVGQALAGIARELPVTLEAIGIVLAVSIVELAAGLVLARAARRAPFESIADAALAAFVAVVLKDLVELSVLGQLGLFRFPELATIDLAVLVLGWRLGPPIRTTWRPTLGGLARLAFLALVGVIWIGPVLVQLASPVVPFIDVLPNHVAPAQHLQTFGAFTPLTSTQSPIYGPSRSLLGYTAVLGAASTLSGIPAAITVSAFAVPATVLVALAIYRLAVVAAGPTAGAWALLAFPLSESFARLSDDRGTVLVLIVVGWALAFVLDPPEPDTWRLPRGVILGLALGAAVFVHPVIGALAIATVVVAGIARRGPMADLAVTGGVAAAIVAAPQAATMVGIALPAAAIVIAIVVGVAAGLAIDRASWLHAPLLRIAGWAIAIAIGLALVVIRPPVGPLLAAPLPFLAEGLLLLIAGGIGFVIGAPGTRSAVVLAGLGVGFAVAIGTQAVPAAHLGLLGQALRFELPKTIHYWIPVIATIAAAASLAWLWRGNGLPRYLGAAVVAAWIVAAAAPLRATPIDALHQGEHRYSEALAIDLRVAGSGFWIGYPDSHFIIDQPRRDLIKAIGLEIAAGRIGPDTPVLHVTGDFQQWAATPLGVFAGVTETDVSPNAEHSIHTVGGRLLDLDTLPSLLASRAYPYLLFEPSPALPDGIAGLIAAAGYTPGYSNGQGTIYRLGPELTNP